MSTDAFNREGAKDVESKHCFISFASFAPSRFNPFIGVHRFPI